METFIDILVIILPFLIGFLVAKCFSACETLEKIQSLRKPLPKIKSENLMNKVIEMELEIELLRIWAEWAKQITETQDIEFAAGCNEEFMRNEPYFPDRSDKEQGK